MSNLNELERKQKELMAAAEAVGAEIERLKKEGEIEIEYLGMFYLSNRSGEKNDSVVVNGTSGVDISVINQRRIILSSAAKETRHTWGFARGYHVGNEVLIIANNHNHFEELYTINDCKAPPFPSVQAQHKEIIRKYLANRPKESRTFRVEDVDKAWAQWVESFGFEFEMVNSKGKYYSNGKNYPVCENYLRTKDDDGDSTALRDSSTIKLSPALYQALKPYLDLSKAL